MQTTAFSVNYHTSNMSKKTKLPDNVVTAEGIIDEILAKVKNNGQLIDSIIDRTQKVDRGVAKLNVLINSEE